MAFTNPDTVHMPQMNSHTTLQGRGTPIVSHAMPTPHPAHPPPPMSHLSNFIGGHTSQPPNPSSAAPWFNASSRSFVPRARVTLRKPDGTVVKIEDLAKASRHTTAPASPSLQHTSPHRNEIPSMPQKTNSPHLASILIESEDQRNARLAEEEKKHQEEALANAEAEKKVRKEEKEERRKRKEKERIRKEAKKAEAMRIAEEKAKKEEEQRFGAKRIAKKAEEVALAKTREDEAKRIRIEAMAIATAAAKRAAQPAPESQDDKPARRINTISPTFNLTAESINIPNPLATARIIADISSIQYLDSISGPRPELNENPKEGELHYNRSNLSTFGKIIQPPSVFVYKKDAAKTQRQAAVLGMFATRTPQKGDPMGEVSDNEEKTVVAFLERLVQMNICSTDLVPTSEQDDVIKSIVNDIALRAPDALRKLSLMVKGGGLRKDYVGVTEAGGSRDYVD